MTSNLKAPVSLRHLHEAEARIVEVLKRYIDERSEAVETRLLTAFHGWARPVEIRLRSASTSVQGFDERLALLEERVSRIEGGDRP